MAPLHNRMPVILDPADYDTWLDPTQPDAEALLRPCSDDWLEVVPVSTGVNNVRNEGPDLIVPLGAEPN
jgi:putative SOS response-associated peptidase YedK